jgi:hypothetical protein
VNKRTLTALRGSITKWESIVAGTDIDKGADNCPLCAIFTHRRNPKEVDDNSSCKGCPVYEKTGRFQCEGSPYYDYDPETLSTAIAELNFLKSLLPEGEL